MELTAETPGRDKDLVEPQHRSPGQVLPGALQAPAVPAPGSNGNGNGSAPASAPARPWTVAESARIYGIRNWGLGYFSVNDAGHVVVQPNQDPAKRIDLKKLVDEL